MRAYLLRLFGIFLIVGTGELMLPEGNIKKYAKVLMSILVCHTLLSPIGVVPGFEIGAEVEEAAVSDTFEENVLAEYKKRIEESILERGGQGCDVILNDDMTIKKVILTGAEEDAKSYIVNDLGVSESDIEVREN